MITVKSALEGKDKHARAYVLAQDQRLHPSQESGDDAASAPALSASDLLSLAEYEAELREQLREEVKGRAPGRTGRRAMILDPAELQRKSLKYFVRMAFAEFHPNDPPLALGWYMLAMVHAAEQTYFGDIRRLAVNVPPRHGKSITYAVAFTAWLLGRDPTLKSSSPPIMRTSPGSTTAWSSS